MPRYKVNEKTYNLPEDKVEGFLIKFPDAILIEDEPQDFPKSAAADADVVQPMTASRASVTELPLEDTSSESQENGKVTLEQFKTMTVAEKKQLSYSDRQRLPRELYKEENNVLDEIESEAFKKFKSGALRVGSNLAQIPAFINRLKMTTAVGIAGVAFEEEVEKFKELDPITQDRIAQAIGSFSGGPISNIGAAGSAGLEAAKNLKNDAKKIEETLTKYENTIGQDFIKGNVSQAVSRTFNEVIGTIPSIVQAFVPYVGISSIVAGSAADYSTEALAEGKKLDAANMIASTATGFSEGLLELTTKKIGKGLFKSLAGKSKDVVSKTLKEAALQTAKEAGQEGLSESTTEVLNRSIDALYKNKGNEWNNIWPELADVFIIGAAAGGGMSGSGSAASIINKAVQVNSVNRTLEENNSESVLSEFELNSSSDKSIGIAKNKYSGNILDIELRKKVSDGDISTEESNSIKQKFNITQKNVKIADDLNIKESLFKETIDLLNERQGVVSEIAKAGENKSLVQTQNERLKEIDSRLSSISAENKLKITTEKVTDIVEGIKSINIEIAKDKEQADKIAKDKNLQKKASTEQGYILQDPKTGEQTIVINEEIAKKDFAVNVAAHELLHGVLFKTVVDSPDTAVNLGNALKSELDKIDANQIKDSNFKKRLELYKKDPDAIVGEETLTLFSDAIATGDLVFEENLFTRIGDTIRRVLQKAGLTGIKFNNGRDVYNFIKDYNKSIEKGELTKAQTKAVTKGIEGELVKPKVKTTDETIVKESLSRQDSDISPKGRQYIDLFKEGFIENEQLVGIINSPSSKPEEKFGAIDAVVEANWPVISNSIKFNPTGSIPIESVKTAVKEQLQGIFPGRKKELFKDFDPSRENKVTTILGPKFLGMRQAEILERAKNIGEKKQDGASTDSDQAKQVVDRSTSTSVAVDKLAKKPTETTKFKSNYISPKFKESLDTSKSEKEAIEDKISSTVKESFKDKKVSRFKETGKIPQKLAQLYSDMFGIKTTSALIEKQRNLQKLDQEGAVRARQFLIDNATADFARLPRSKDDTGKATGILQTKIGKVLYNKAGELTGSLKTYTDIIKGKNITLEGYDGKQYEFNQLDNEGKKKPIYRDAQHIKAALDFHIRNRALETLIPEQGKRIQAGAKFSVKNKETLNQIAQAKNINEATKLAGIKDKITVNDNNRAKKQEQMLGFIISGNIPSIIFEAGKFGNFGKWNRRGKIVGGVLIPLPKPAAKYFKTKDGKLIKEGSKEYALAEKNGDFLATRGGLYYGVKDPAYVEALEASKENDSKYPKLQKAKRVNEKNAFTEKGQKQSDVNLDTLQVMAEVLADAVHSKGMPIEIAALYISSSYQATTGIIKLAGKFKYRSEKMEYGPADSKTGQRTGAKFREEHNPPASTIGAYLIYAISKNEVKPFMSIIKDNYYQTLLSKADDHKLDMAKLDARLPEGTSILNNSAIRLVEAGIDINSLINPFNNKTMAEELGVSLNKGDRSLENIAEQNKLLKDLILEEGEYKNPQAYLNDFVKLSSITKASKVNNKNSPSSVKFSKKVTNKEALDNLGNIDKALSIARNADAPVKKIRVFDFDDTLATTKSNVLYTMPDGKTGSLTATEFAKNAGEMEAQGAEWDFSEFSKVMKGAKGPLLDVAKFINDAKGERDVFVLTARPQDAAGPIKEFLDSMGLNIPLENITGLGDGTAQAKARWMVDKAAEGYNDFYFADDASKNVKAVKDALSVLDVKSKVQQAYVKFSNANKLNKDFNDILEGATGIASEKIYGSAKAQVAGASRGKVFRGIAYSAQDFVGLLYETLGKGKEGDAQMAWYKKNLLDPYARAMNDLSSARLAMMNDYRALKKQLGIVPKNLRKKLPGEPWTREQAVRVYVWSKQGTDLPGISKNDLKDLNGFVANNAELQVFADQLIAIQKGDMYPEPGESWVSGSISTDMLKGLNTIKRVKYLEQWQANVDAIFSKENKNKLEAAYGVKYVKALENSLERMKTGRNRSFSDDSLTGRFTDWLQGSVGAIMFFNTRSAVLQTLSAVNFVNFTDNNPYAAAKAFGNQKQYWKDFTTLMNSDFLKERRSGLRMNVNEADIADMAKQEGPRGVINKLLQLGFAPTQIADSFAIASGGATFYRNRAKTYMKEGMDQAQAEEKAFQDFRENAEESQQSSRPDKISAQQAGPLGRLILAFANTPAQYARLTDKAIRDLKNNRGDAKTNISKIIYYTTVQNIIFNAVQQALFAMAFGDEEPEDEKKQEKYISIANGMADSLLRGTGIAGSVVSVGKNAVIRIINESEKKRPKYEKVGYELTKISPPVSAKLSRINQAARTYEWNKEEMMTKGFSLDNPAFLAGGNVVSALTNIPLDRVVKKVNNVVKATESDMELWERVALFAGWQDWELGIKEEKKPKARKSTRKFKTRKFKTRKFN